MHDIDLFVCQNARPAISTHASAIATWPLPSLVAPNYLDLRVAMDLARAGGIYANFRIATAFSATASNFLRFAIFTDSTPTFANVITNNELVLARGPDLPSASLNIVGTTIVLPVPPLNDLVQAIGAGRRYLGLGLQAFAPSADWSAGGIDAWFSVRAHQGLDRPLSPASGY